MTKTFTAHTSFLTRMQSPIWQAQLRACVHLYLEFSTRPALAQEVDAQLQRTEAELLDYLLAGASATAAEYQRARYLLDVAQHRLLDSELQEQFLLLSRGAH